MLAIGWMHTETKEIGQPGAVPSLVLTIHYPSTVPVLRSRLHHGEPGRKPLGFVNNVCPELHLRLESWTWLQRRLHPQPCCISLSRPWLQFECKLVSLKVEQGKSKIIFKLGGRLISARDHMRNWDCYLGPDQARNCISL